MVDTRLPRRPYVRFLSTAAGLGSYDVLTVAALEETQRLPIKERHKLGYLGVFFCFDDKLVPPEVQR